MQLTPSYGPDPIVVLDGDPAAIAVPASRQRRRLAASLQQLTDVQWNHPSRCADWSVKDVVVHLDGTNGFWDFTTQSGLAGERTEMMASFDPVATPAAMVAARESSVDDALTSFIESTDRLVATWEGIDAGGWTELAEAPPGHVSISAVTHHALWDSWIHERDILVPLGIETGHEPDEVSMSLRYVAALGPTVAAVRQSGRRGRFAVVATDPDVQFTVEVGDVVRVTDGAGDDAFVLSGDAVELLEALSFRGPLNHEIPNRHTWMFSGLGEVFEHVQSSS